MDKDTKEEIMGYLRWERDIRGRDLGEVDETLLEEIQSKETLKEYQERVNKEIEHIEFVISLFETY